MLHSGHGLLTHRNLGKYSSIIILDPVPAKMRDYCKISKELKSDGSNVAGVLCALAPEEKKKVEALVSSYVRHFLNVI